MSIGKGDIQYVVLDAPSCMRLLFIQLRDGSTLSSKRQAGVPLARSVGGRLPGGACVPPLLEGWKHKILLAGKYLNVIRECGMEVNQNQNYPDDEELLMDDPRHELILKLNRC